ncbi:(+)-T-muurolol synthase [Streptomyces sp. ADI96-02]|uniref:terpene synthase family protein n=1 Tax=unclassified Streptomyces TaxID=2593676 RepID=UPI000F555919|nr:terpene synthase family protein [Streptomyces sp. ADI96-02]RPK55078.1 (+)-T-muurolol synthase [Streptomyces sp. ADI96-02]
MPEIPDTTTSQLLHVPPLYCPIGAAVHPELDSINRDSRIYLDRYHLHTSDIDRAWVIARNYAEAMARIYPEGITDRVALTARWLHWIFYVDDVRMETATTPDKLASAIGLTSHLLRVMESPATEPTADQTGPVAALQSLMTSVQAVATPTQLHRFVDAHRKWFHAILWGMAAPALSSLDEFVHQRMLNAGGAASLCWSEITTGEEIPGDEFHSPAMRALQESSFLMMALDNDLLSYNRERLIDGTKLNIVMLLARLNDCPPEQAIHQAVALRDRLTTLFLRLREQEHPKLSAPGRAYVADLGYAIRSNLDWGSHSARYTVVAPRTQLPPENPAPIPLTLTDHPGDPSTEPLPCPSIAWWWQQLRT